MEATPVLCIICTASVPLVQPRLRPASAFRPGFAPGCHGGGPSALPRTGGAGIFLDVSPGWRSRSRLPEANQATQATQGTPKDLQDSSDQSDDYPGDPVFWSRGFGHLRGTDDRRPFGHKLLLRLLRRKPAVVAVVASDQRRRRVGFFVGHFARRSPNTSRPVTLRKQHVERAIWSQGLHGSNRPFPHVSRNAACPVKAIRIP